MTTADTATARPSAWQRFRTWRRGRPFWGGLVAIVAGIEIYASSQTSIGDMEIKIGPGGMASYVIPLMLMVAGLLAWFTPAQRHFYGIVVPAVSIYALLEINFGGWFIGTLLGMVGGALIFAWAENKTEAVADEAGDPEPDGGEAADDADHAPRHAAFDELFGEPGSTAIPRQGESDDDREVTPTQEKGGGTSGRMFAIAIVPLLLVVAGLVAVRAPEAAYAAPCPVSTTKTVVRPAKTQSKATTKVTTPASPKAAGVAPSQSPAAAPAEASPSPSPEVGLLGKIVNGIVNLLDPSPSASPDEPPAQSPQPSASPETPQPQPSTSGAPTPTTKPTSKPTQKPSACASASPSPVPTAKQLRAAVGQPDVASKPSRMTGSLVTMDKLTFVGVVDLPTADGTIKALKFTMDESVTSDFELLTYASGAHTKDIVFKAKKLTVKQNVAFYTSRFQGNLLGVIPVDYTPENPPIIPPPGIPLPIEIFFTDPDIQLVWVTADVLTGTPSLTSTLA